MGKKYITDIVSIGDHSLDAAGMVQIDALIADGLHSDAGYLTEESGNTKLTDAQIAEMGYIKTYTDTNTNTQLTSAQIAGMGYLSTTTGLEVFRSEKNTDDQGTYMFAQDDGGWTGGARLAGAHNGYGVISMHLHTGGYYGQIHLSSKTGDMGIRFQEDSDTWGSIYTVHTSKHFSTADVANGKTAHGWGNHADAGYITTDNNTTYNFVGTTFTSRNSTNPIAVDSGHENMVGYTNKSTAAGYSDGGLFVAAYSTSWVSQIFSNFRTGELSTRGKNNGTWQAWRTIHDSGHFSTTDVANGVTAHGWGNHAGAGYLTSYTDTNTQLTSAQIAAMGYVSTSQIDTVSGEFPFMSKKLSGTGIGSSYDQRVVLIVPRVTTNTSSHNKCVGKITASKTGGNVFDTLDISVNSVWNNTEANFLQMGQRSGHKWVTCLYGGVEWIAIKFELTANPYTQLYFYGQHKANSLDVNNDSLKVISYLDTRSGVLNAEINNSIADWTSSSNRLTFNGNNIHHAGNLTSVSQLANDSGYITSYTDTDTNTQLTTAQIGAMGYIKENEDRRHKVLRFTGEGSNSNNSGINYGIYQEGGGWAHPYPDLVIGYHTGVKIGAYRNYNGTRFYSDAPGRSGAVELMSVGDGDSHVRVTNVLYAGDSVRAPGFFDTNDTSYYLNPAGTSSINGLEIKGVVDMKGRVGSWITSDVFNDAIGWNSSYGVYIGSNVGGTHYLRGNGTFTTGGSTYTLYHTGNLTLSTLGYTGATNANYITNNNQISNGASYLTTAGKAADSNLLDGIDSSRIVYGHNDRKSTRADSVGIMSTTQNSGFHYGSSPTNGPTTDWNNWITCAGGAWVSGNNYDFKISHPFHSDKLYVGRMTNGVNNGWRQILTTGMSVNIGASYSFTGAAFYDASDTQYLVDPGGSSAFNRIKIINNTTPFMIKVNSGYKSWVHHIASDDTYVFAPSTANGGESWDWANQMSISTSGIVTANNFVLRSDERSKTKIKNLTRDNIDVSWKSFEMKGNEGDYRTGVIAQELEETHPEFVNTDPKGFKSVKYIDLLIAKIAELEARLEKLEK